MILEVCVDTFSSLLTAKKAGADRIELCSALALGGLTPSYGLIMQAKKVDIEVAVMIRPRSGDFLYNNEEFETVLRDIELVKSINASNVNAIVVGILKPDGRIDFQRMKRIVEFAAPLKTVLHRAFDDALIYDGDIEKLIDIGVVRILTSGKTSIDKGQFYIKKLIETYGDKITIMPGGGINFSNLESIIETTKAKQYHMSGKVSQNSKMEYTGYVEKMNTPSTQLKNDVCSYLLINKAKKILNNVKMSPN